jgi:hypothetical protein
VNHPDDVATRLAALKRRSAALRPKGMKPVVITPAKPLLPDMLPRARSGAETLAAMGRINADRAAVRRVMLARDPYRMDGPPSAEGPHGPRRDAWDVCLMGMAASTRREHGRA